MNCAGSFLGLLDWLTERGSLLKQRQRGEEESTHNILPPDTLQTAHTAQSNACVCACTFCVCVCVTNRGNVLPVTRESLKLVSYWGSSTESFSHWTASSVVQLWTGW